jgi:hypothetical protein
MIFRPAPTASLQFRIGANILAIKVEEKYVGMNFNTSIVSLDRLPTRNLVLKSVGYRGLITVTAPYYVSYPFWELTCSVFDATWTRCTLLKRFES